MGFRSLIEINHDDITQIMFDSGQFAKELARYVSSGDSRTRMALEYYNITVVAMRHSADSYIVPARTPGFPTELPFEEFQQHIGSRVREAKAMTKGSNKSKAELETMVASLVDIIERLNKGESTVS